MSFIFVLVELLNLCLCLAKFLVGLVEFSFSLKAVFHGGVLSLQIFNQLILQRGDLILKGRNLFAFLIVFSLQLFILFLLLLKFVLQVLAFAARGRLLSLYVRLLLVADILDALQKCIVVTVCNLNVLWVLGLFDCRHKLLRLVRVNVA